MEYLQQLPTKIAERKANTFYFYKGYKKYWNGKILLCEHKCSPGRCRKAHERNNSHLNSSIEQLNPSPLPPVAERRKNTYYYITSEKMKFWNTFGKLYVYWTGKELHCKHRIKRCYCDLCGQYVRRRKK